jgi:hypothetical protein
MVTIVTSHWKEDLSWLKNSEFPVVLIDKEGADPTCFEPSYVIPNKGKEASVYLKFIIEKYHELPDYVAFIHGHEYAWHQQQNILELIRNANIEKHGFISLNSVYKDWWAGGAVYPFANVWEIYSENKMYVFENIPSSAQFIVSKERILLNSVERYKNLYDMIITSNEKLEIMTNNTFYTWGPETIFETCWHILFGESNIYNIPYDLFKIPLNITEHLKLSLHT